MSDIEDHRKHLDWMLAAANALRVAMVATNDLADADAPDFAREMHGELYKIYNALWVEIGQLLYVSYETLAVAGKGVA